MLDTDSEAAEAAFRNRPEGGLMRVTIAGAGSVGRSVARELLDNGHEVLLIDRDPSRHQEGVGVQGRMAARRRV